MSVCPTSQPKNNRAKRKCRIQKNEVKSVNNLINERGKNGREKLSFGLDV